MPDAPYDPRAIANLILDFAASASVPVRHISLQKLLYFAHATYLMHRGRPLLKGPFEAWKFGPVHPTVYQSFKAAGENPIDFRARAKNVLTGEARDVEMPNDPDVCLHVMHIVATYGRMSTSRLIDLSHMSGGPWHHVVTTSARLDGGLVYGERIDDNLIRAYFARPVVGLKAADFSPDDQEPRCEAEPSPSDRRSELRRP